MAPVLPGSEGGFSTALAPELRSQIERLVLLARIAVGNQGQGAHRGRWSGRGTEFLEHKAYAPGDEVRSLDWRVLARSDRYVVRQHQVERTLFGYLLVDGSASMDFGGEAASGDTAAPLSKWEGGATVAAALAWLMMRQGDAAQVAVSGPGAADPPTPRRGSGQLEAVCADLVATRPRGKASLSRGVEALAARIQGPALVVVATDALDEDLDWIATLATLRARGADPIVTHVIHPLEMEFPYQDPARFEDLETGELLRVNPRALAAAYRVEFRAFVEEVGRRCLEAGLSYLRVDTGRSIALTLREFLEGRRRLSGGTR